MLRTINFSSYMSLTSSNCYTEAGNRKYIITLKHSYASVYIFRLPGVNKRPGQPHETIGLLFFSCSLSNFILKTLVKKTAQALTSQIRQDSRMITHCNWTSYCNGITGSFPYSHRNESVHMVGIKIQNRVIDSDKYQGSQCLIGSTDAG
jgi:hypothetical protein